GPHDPLFRASQAYPIAVRATCLPEPRVRGGRDPADVAFVLVPVTDGARDAVGETRARSAAVTAEMLDEPVTEDPGDVFTGIGAAVATREPDDLDLATRFADLSGVRVGLLQSEQGVLRPLHQQCRNVDVVGDSAGRDAVQQPQCVLARRTVECDVPVGAADVRAEPATAESSAVGIRGVAVGGVVVGGATAGGAVVRV